MSKDNLYYSWVNTFFSKRNWIPLPFQQEAWKAILKDDSGLVNAPTGSGKTLSVLPPILWKKLNSQKTTKSSLFCIWITPLRSLSKQIQLSIQDFLSDMCDEFSVEVRNGDTSLKVRARQAKKLPHILITTPESFQLLICSKGWKKKMEQVDTIVVDEWHELMGSKRGVQLELCLSALRFYNSKLKTWGISATIGNLDEAKNVLIGKHLDGSYVEGKLIKSSTRKKIEVEVVSPKKIKELPWRGHLGLHLVEDLIPILKRSKTTLIFTNTRSQCEIWYQHILSACPEFSGLLAMHHGSIEKEIRLWVEDAVRKEKLKAVICTSSLDLGVDFYPVETIIQIGGPKGVARFLQRAGRSGHRPDQISKIYFLPTHAIELIEASALKKAAKKSYTEPRVPYVLSYDVLIQFLVSLAVSDGFRANEALSIVRKTHAFCNISDYEWEWILTYISKGATSLSAYNEYKKVQIIDDGLFKVLSRGVAMRHRVQIGTIVSDNHLNLKLLSGKRLGVIEEWFISKLKKGDVFLFGGQYWELFQIQQMDVLVKKSKSKKGKVVSWMGGRMSFTSYMSDLLRNEIYSIQQNTNYVKTLKPLSFLLDMQKELSIIPNEHEFLIESFQTSEGFHTVFYAFEGRFVHEAMSHLMAYRISLLIPISFSLAYNDYGFELLSDQFLDVNQIIENNLFEATHVKDDLEQSINASEIARRKFRDIAVISGLVFSGMPSNRKRNKDLQSGSQLIFEVFRDYEPENLLYKQAFFETFEYQLEEERLIKALFKIKKQKIVWKNIEKPSPFSFPIITDRLREKLSSEELGERIKKMQLIYQ